MQSNDLRYRILSSLSSKKGNILACAVLLLISGIFLLQVFGKAYREHGYDFTSYLLSSRALLEGANPYDTGSPFPFIYPLFLCVVLYPFTIVPYWLSILLWFLTNLAAMHLCALVLLKLYCASLWYKGITALSLIPFLMLTDVIQNNLLNGQVNFIVLLLCVLFLRYYLGSHKLMASVALAGAISIKLTPLVFIAYLLFRKDFLWATVVLAMSFLLTLGLPYAISGPATFQWYSYYFHTFLLGTIATTGQASGGFSFSFTSLFSSLIPSMPMVLSLSLSSIVSLMPIAAIQLSSYKDESGHKQSLVFALYMLAILLVSPVSETHHLINLFPAIAVVTVTMLLHSRRHWHVGLVALTIALVSLIAGKFCSAAHMAGIVALYVSMLWIWHEASSVKHRSLKL